MITGEESVFRTPPEAIFNVRGRAIGFLSGEYGAEVYALERGYFPISGTGYRSLCGEFGAMRPLTPADVPSEFLLYLATKADEGRRSAVVALNGPPQCDADGATNFLAAKTKLESAIQLGFFASDPERRALWQGAERWLGRMLTDPKLQPTPNRILGDRASCTRRLEEQRGLHAFLQQVMRGDFSAPPPRCLYYSDNYYSLPPRPGGEPAIPPAAPDADLLIGLPTMAATPLSPRARGPKTRPATASSPSSQISLF